MSEPEQRPRSTRGLVSTVVFAAMLAAFFVFGRPPVSFSFDPDSERCLPEFKYGILVHRVPADIKRGAYVFWHPAGALAYVKQEYVLKRVEGVPGDHLRVEKGIVTINGRTVVEGMALAPFYHRGPDGFDRAETIPLGKYFVVGTHPLSDDSRYWGYLDVAAILGVGYPLHVF